MPAGHGKSYLMLYVTALLLKMGLIKSIKLVYHESEIMSGES